MFNKYIKGSVGQIRAELRAIEKGWVPARPLIESRFDLLMWDGAKTHRVQVKHGFTQNGAVKVDLRKQCRNNGIVKLYTKEEIDAVVIYSADPEALLWVPPEVFDGAKQLVFRFQEAANGQIKHIRWLEHFLW